MPSLREMREDIPLIANAILARLVTRQPGADSKSRQWPRSNAIRFPATCASSRTSSSAGCRSPPIRSASPPEDLHLTPVADETDSPVPAGDKWPLQDYLDRVERAAINEALEKTRYNRTAAAKLLGITFRAMRYRMERLAIRVTTPCISRISLYKVKFAIPLQ